MKDITPGSFSENVRQVVVGGETWYALEDILSLFKDDRAWWQKLLSRIASGPLTKPFEDLIKVHNFNGQEQRALTGVGVFRLLQDIPGKAAESLRRIIAERSFELAKEEADPELAVRRAIRIYKQAGRTDGWIKARMRSIIARNAFTDEMQVCGAEGSHYGMLTNILHERTFDINVKQHMAIKKLDKENLRDHMTEIELTLTTLGEQAATTIARSKLQKTLNTAVGACEAGGSIAGNARKEIEAAIGQSVVSRQNFLTDNRRSSLTDGAES